MSFMLLGILNSQAAGAGGSSFDLLATTTLTGNASISFTNIDQTYSHLQLRVVVRKSGSGDTVTSNGVELNSTTGGYGVHTLAGNSSSVVVEGFASSTRLNTEETAPNNGTTTGAFGANVFDILDYSNTSKFTTVRTLGGVHTANEKGIAFQSALYPNLSAITSIELIGTYVAGTRMSLYGIKG
tara:strand:- start:1013 stop:1564 length:552 start_codon:yes stop_codon:yes gene_type:complete